MSKSFIYQKKTKSFWFPRQETLKTERLFSQNGGQVLGASAGSEFPEIDNPVLTFVQLALRILAPGHGYRKPYCGGAFSIGTNRLLDRG